MKKYEIIAVDFDGTLCSDCYPDIGKPNLPLIELLKALKREGCRIVLWTCRCGRELEQAVQWCEEFGLEFDKVNRNTDEILEKYGSDSRKIYADVYIDDKACFSVGSHGIQKGGIRDDSRDHSYKYKKEKQGVDLETLFVTALTAFTGGIGIIAVFAVLTWCGYLSME